MTDTTPVPHTRRPLALVTGASSGIGLELAGQLGERGYDLFVSSEDAGALETAVDALRSGSPEVTSYVADLRSGEQVEALYAAVVAGGRPLAVAALNAGIGHGGAFVDQGLDDELDVIRLNVLGTVHLTKLVLDDMVDADAGRVLITSSIASTMPGAYQTTYNASKSFLQSFSEALSAELNQTDVVVTALMPGPTDTGFFARAGLEDSPLGRGPKDDPAEVARQGLDALLAGKQKVVASSVTSKATAAVAAVLPDKVKALLHKKANQPTGR